MEEEIYHLRCSVHGHTKDIRALVSANVPSGGIITGSRDRTVRVWTPNLNDSGYAETHCMLGPAHYISSVCTLPPSAQYPSGLILAGSNDCAIYGFTLESTQPVLKLLGHSGTAGNFGTVASGSWDKTARVWLGQKCVMTLEGHQEAVWAVQMFPEQGLTLTGSADKSIRLWRAGNCEKIFNGHEDCVRGLAVLSNSEFLSCSNDCTIRQWQTNGNCIGIYYGHTGFIYSIAVLHGSGDFVTSSEDQTVKLWKGGICCQTLNLPAQSLWAITCLNNEDIVVGGSDGVLRIFTKHSELRASPDELALYEKELNKASLLKNKQMIGDLKLDDLPGPEILKDPGTKDGQTKLCRDGNSVSVHQWSSAEQKWLKIGDVVDANDSSPEKKKTTYEGKDYDYVFTIDVEDGKYLKLPYNVSEDPWLVAQKFIEKHDLNQMFLDQIANFIVTNSHSTAASATPHNQFFADPFTGQNRYIPGTTVAPLTQPKTTQKAESTVLAENGTLEKPSGASGDTPKGNTYFPQLTCLRFDTANIEGIEFKLIEFSDLVNKNQQLSAKEIQQLLLLANFPTQVTDQQMASLEKIMSWPKDYVFPALDIFRLAVRSEAINKKVGEAGGIQIANHLLNFLSSSNPIANQMLTLRTFCNLFGHAPGETVLTSHREKILSVVKNFISSSNKHIQIALSTLYLNYAVAFSKSPNSQANQQLTLEVVNALQHMNDSEALFRILVCIGTLIADPETKKHVKSLDVPNALALKTATNDSPKLKSCSQYLLAALH